MAKTNGGTFIRTSRLCRYYKRGPHEIRAVDNIGLTIHRAELLAIVGASGSGKSTLLNLLAGLDTPTSGVIEVGDMSLAELSRREIAVFRARRVGMIFQSFNLMPQLSAIRNVELGLYFSDVGRRERRRRAAEILERLGMGERLEHIPAELSGGEQQRVAIARAVIKEPEILLADEPTGNLDQDNSEQIGRLLREFNRDGLTIIMATHNQMLAGAYGQRILRMRYGTLADGVPPPEPGMRS